MQKETKPPPQTAKNSDLRLNSIASFIVVNFFITIAALCYSIISASHQEGAGLQLSFPWLGWLASMLIASAVIVALVHGMSRKSSSDTAENESTWEGYLSEKMQRRYRLIKDAPVIVIVLSLLLLGATLFAVDGAFAVVQLLIQSFSPYIPYMIAGIVSFAIAIAALMAFFKYKNNRLAAEYAFRKDVLEKTGIVLVDSKSKALVAPDTPELPAAHVLDRKSVTNLSLPSGHREADDNIIDVIESTSSK